MSLYIRIVAHKYLRNFATFSGIGIHIARCHNTVYLVCCIKNVKEIIFFIFTFAIRIAKHKFITLSTNHVAIFL